MSSDQPIKRQRLNSGDNAIAERENVSLEPADEEETTSDYLYGSVEVIPQVDNEPPPVEHLLEEERERARVFEEAQQAERELNLLEDLFLDGLVNVEKNTAEPFRIFIQEVGNHDLEWIASHSADHERRADRLLNLDYIPNRLTYFGHCDLVHCKSVHWRRIHWEGYKGKDTEQG